MLFARHKRRLPTAEEALPGRDVPLSIPPRHLVKATPLQPPFPDGLETAVFAMGCFWGAERVFWTAPGVYTTAGCELPGGSRRSRVGAPQGQPAGRIS